MKLLRGTIVIVGFLMLTLPLMPVQAAFVAFSPRMARCFPHWYHRILARLMGIDIAINGTCPEPGTLVVANHVSWLDIVVLSATAPLSFIAKKEVKGWPLFGQMAKLQRTLFVDRERKAKTATVRDGIGERLRQGDALVLFPEGTSGDGNRVLPFKSSLFGVADSGDAPVVPVTIAYTHANGLPITHRERPRFAWYGDMDLAPHLWNLVKSGPVSVAVNFHQPLDKGVGRKLHARQAESTIRDSLAEMLHGRTKIR